jgi:THUMP domain-like/RNA cap guanine-N2 methyltransferase
MKRRHHYSPDQESARVQYQRGELATIPSDVDVDAEAWVLTTEPGSRLLAALATVRSLGPSDMANFRKQASARHVSAAIRLVRARSKAALKFEHGERLWVEPTAIQQATSEVVAQHKAKRFVCPLVVDLCAGIGGDALALAARSDVMAVDLDQGMCCRLRYNASIYKVDGRILSVRARAEAFAIPAGAWLHLDPDRRATGKGRARTLDDYAPGRDFWKSATRQCTAGAIKLGPASDFAKYFSGPEFEVELVSLRGECKEATVWFGELVSCRRRATRLPENVSWTDRDGPSGHGAPVTPLGTLIFDPDPSLLRAGLLDGFALEHGIGRVADGVDYLTGERSISTPFLTAFRVLDVLPLDLKRLRRLIARNQIGILEIKVRGADVAPETLRRQLHLRGERTASLLIIGGSGPARAVLAQRASMGGSSTSSTADPPAERDSASGAEPLPSPSA